MGIRNAQIGWGQETKLWYEVLKAIPKIRKALSPYVPPTPPPQVNKIRLVFPASYFTSGPVTDPNDVSQWNALFDLPTYGTPFTSVSVSGTTDLTIDLFGGSGITIRDNIFLSANIKVFDDQTGCVIGFEPGSANINSSFRFSTIEIAKFPAVQEIGAGTFNSVTTLQELYFTSLLYCFVSCSTVASTFGPISGANITLTVPLALTTCNSGSIDATIQATLISSNTVTIITV